MKITALAGGVGGAKLVHGLAQILPPEDLTIIVNTGDDFEHFGLYICPDLDTVCYTLAGLANPETGWGRAGETWKAMDNLRRLGAPDWFNLGDSDLATHLERTRRLKAGQTLTQITHDFCAAWGIHHTILPMSDQPVRTMVNTVEYGELPFQEYFVKYRCEPRVHGFRFAGAEIAEPAPGAREALQAADAVVICPSNPWVSIDPILNVLKLQPMSRPLPPVIAVSPIIGGRTVKGPAAKMFTELGIEPSALAVAEHYRGLLRGFVLDTVDSSFQEAIRRLKIEPLVAGTIMQSTEDRRRLAEAVLHLVGKIL
ncbi:MAG: 2-phospho-L-lactate transferase [Anaerolineae bacterium]